MRRLAAWAVVAVMSVTGCGASATDRPAEVVTVTTTAAPTPTLDERQEVLCQLARNTGSVELRWSLLLAVRGTDEVKRAADEFAEVVSDVAEDAEDCGWAVEATALALEAAVLNANALTGNDDPAAYRRVWDALNAWAAKIGKDDVMFERP